VVAEARGEYTCTTILATSRVDSIVADYRANDLGAA
jgi:hypothetical protein